MKVFWWQAGLHFEPETKAETDALMILWEAKKFLPDISNTPSDSTCSIVREEFQNSVSRN
jgi:hypothetical protein